MSVAYLICGRGIGYVSVGSGGGTLWRPLRSANVEPYWFKAGFSLNLLGNFYLVCVFDNFFFVCAKIVQKLGKHRELHGALTGAWLGYTRYKSGPNSFNFMQFLGKIDQKIAFHIHLWSWLSHFGEILDLPLLFEIPI